MGRKNKKMVFVPHSNVALEFGPHVFCDFGDELVYQNAALGKKIVDPDRLYTGTGKQNLRWAFWDKKTGRFSAMVDTTVRDLKRLVALAERDEKKFKKADKKAGRKLGGYFKHFGNISFFFVREE